MSANPMIVNILENFWPKNKAKGLLAQTILMQEVAAGDFGPEAEEKLLTGCWLLAPKGADFYKYRFCFFVHPRVMRAADEFTPKAVFGDLYRPFHAIAEFMNNAGIGVLYVVPVTETGELPLDEILARGFTNINWVFLSFQNGEFIERDPREFFDRWPGDRGRAGNATAWDERTKTKIAALDTEILTELLLNELFYIGFIKGILKKPLSDPYDVDSFLISLSQQNIFPMEIKEKFPAASANEKFFGIDAGRVMMLLRVCLPNDANALYLIRELDEQGNFIGWKYITLSDIVMTSSWNLQAGGPGMGGGSTQTIKLPYDYFKTFNADAISEDNLRQIGDMPKDIKLLAREFGRELSARFHE